jgi:hypothetical protein
MAVIVGNGIDTQFDIDAGFPTPDAIVRCEDAFSGVRVLGIQFVRETPSVPSVRLLLDPAPATGSVRVFISDGTEMP